MTYVSLEKVLQVMAARFIDQTVGVFSSLKADESFDFEQKGLRRKMFGALSRKGSKEQSRIFSALSSSPLFSAWQFCAKIPNEEFIVASAPF